MNMHVDVVIVSELCSAIHPRCTSTMSGSRGELKPLCEQEEPWSQPRPWAPWYNGWWSHVYLSTTYEDSKKNPDNKDKKDPDNKDEYDPGTAIDVVDSDDNAAVAANKPNPEPKVKKDRSRSPRGK